jgi:hypothetical protein
MNSTLLSLIPAIVMAILLHSSAEAFWGFGSSPTTDKSGLNLEQGYDRNTVVTITGRVAALPDSAADPVTVELVAGGERTVVVLGPRWYLQDDNLDWKVGDMLTVRGSRAQGRDGRSYLMGQWVNLPGGSQLTLRSDAGRPGWSGGRGGVHMGGGTGGSGQMTPRGGMGGMGGRQGR